MAAARLYSCQKARTHCASVTSPWIRAVRATTRTYRAMVRPRIPATRRIRPSEVTVAGGSRDLVEDRLDLLGPVTAADEERVGSVDDDHVLQADGDDQAVAAVHEDAVG